MICLVTEFLCPNNLQCTVYENQRDYQFIYITSKILKLLVWESVVIQLCLVLVQDYEVVADDGGKDDVWEKEIEDMLNEGKQTKYTTDSIP